MGHGARFASHAAGVFRHRSRGVMHRCGRWTTKITPSPHRRPQGTTLHTRPASASATVSPPGPAIAQLVGVPPAPCLARCAKCAPRGSCRRLDRRCVRVRPLPLPARRQMTSASHLLGGQPAQRPYQFISQSTAPCGPDFIWASTIVHRPFVPCVSVHPDGSDLHLPLCCHPDAAVGWKNHSFLLRPIM